jgi:hypothetical protein
MQVLGISSDEPDKFVRAQLAYWDRMTQLDDSLPVWSWEKNPEPNGALTVIPFLHHQKKMEKWEQEVYETLSQLQRSNSILKAVIDSASFRGMNDKLRIVAKRSKGRYLDPRAQLWLLGATLEGLGTFMTHKVHSKMLREPTAEDWQRARQALQALIEVRDIGIDIAMSWPSLPWYTIPTDWPERLSKKLSERQAFGRPYNDASHPERKACKTFVKRMFINFDGQVSPAIVLEFSALIDFKSNRLPDHVRKWVAELNFRKNEGAEPPPSLR